MERSDNKRRKLVPVQPRKIEEMSILQLNVYCLLKIFSYLGIKDLLNAEEVCPKFQELSLETYKQHKILNLGESKSQCDFINISPADAVKLFRRVGPHINTLSLSNEAIRTKVPNGPSPPIWKYCKNLQTVYFHQLAFKSDICTRMAPALKKVKIAHLTDCGVSESDLSIMFNLRQLTELTLDDTYDHRLVVTRHILEQLQNIQSLTINQNDIDLNSFVNFCRTNTQLRSLKICRGVHRGAIDADCIQAIATNLRNLECLHITCDENIGVLHYLALMELPKIKQLKLDNEYTKHKYIRALLKKISTYDRLEYLEIKYGWNNSIVITPIIGQFTKLKELKLTNAHLCNDKTLEFISKLELLEKLYISSTQITAFGLQNLIKRCKMIRYIDVSSCKKLKDNFIPFIPIILAHLKNRSHTLTIKIVDGNTENILAKTYESNQRLILKIIYCNIF